MLHPKELFKSLKTIYFFFFFVTKYIPLPIIAAAIATITP